jgi:surfactin synthase thioesterase subunit
VIVHGKQDESVDHRRSVEFAQARAGVELHLVEGDHRLTLPRHDELIAWCAQDLIRRIA